jgi:hypothetical protein
VFSWLTKSRLWFLGLGLRQQASRSQAKIAHFFEESSPRKAKSENYPNIAVFGINDAAGNRYCFQFYRKIGKLPLCGVRKLTL